MAKRKKEWKDFQRLSDQPVSEQSLTISNDTHPTAEPGLAETRTFKDKATTRTRQKWLEFQPQHERTMVQCEECQEKLKELSWFTDPETGFGYFQPIYHECSKHPDLFVQWVSDVTRMMNYFRQRC